MARLLRLPSELHRYIRWDSARCRSLLGQEKLPATETLLLSYPLV